jgi:hypothetical protein
MVVSQPSTGDPQANPPYVPLSKHCKFEAFRRQTYSPFTFVSAAWEATWAQLWAQWPQYGGGMEGWSKRFGATLADTESRRFIQSFLLSSLLHQDPRYFPSRKRRLFSRMAYAASRVVITRADDGDNEVNTSELLGTIFTSSLQNAYYPRPDRGFTNTLNRFTGALSSDAISDIVHEFSPDMKRIFHSACSQEGSGDRAEASHSGRRQALAAQEMLQATSLRKDFPMPASRISVASRIVGRDVARYVSATPFFFPTAMLQVSFRLDGVGRDVACYVSPTRLEDL